jgi:ethanolamine utilization microcompartment shell protein EutS
MILTVALPRIGTQPQQVTLHRLIAVPGAELKPGTALFEVRVDLGAASAQDCPPLSFFRIIATERGFLRSLAVAQGAALVAGAPLGIATTTLDETALGAAVRALRASAVAIQIDPLSR